MFMDKCCDVFVGVVKLVFYICEIVVEVGGGVVCMLGGVVMKLGIVIFVVEMVE